MKINEAEEIIDNMYQNKMKSREENTKEGVTIHLGTEVDFTKEEEASVMLLRELQILRNKANKYDSLVSEIKERIEELKNKPLKIRENNKYYYETDAYNKIVIQVLQDLLETIEGEKK